MKTPCRSFTKFLLSSMAVLLLCVPQDVNSAEFVVINRIISYDINASSGFWSFGMNASMPANWASPNDYYHGTFYTRYEILSVPTNVPCGIQMGIFQWQGAHNDSCGELCESIRGPLAGVGAVVTNSSSPSTWWRTEGGVDFSRMSYLESMAIVLYSWDTRYPVAQAGQGGDAGGISWNQRFNWFPITLRVTVVAVSSGSTFSGWDNYIPNPALQKPTPAYGIDYINETTDKVVPATDEYALFPTMFGRVSGSGQKMTLIPGRDAYFRTKAGDGLRQSEIQHFDVPCRPATPKFIMDKVNYRTTTTVSSEYEYSDYSDMSEAVTGNGTYVSIPAGTTKFFRKKATVTSFKSEIQALNESSKSAIPHELLVFNGVIDYPNTTDTNGFYYFYYNADMPKDWTTPDNYYNGNFYMRYEIISQKTSTPVGMQFGLWQLLPPETGELHETMSGITTLNGPGSYATAVSSPSSWWRLDGGFDYTKMDLTWHMGINPWKLDSYNGNLQIRQENASVWAERNTYWFPMKVYVTIVAVASGYSFSGWNNYLGVKYPTPAYTINYTTEKTSQVVPATDEYSYSPTMSPAYPGTGATIDLLPGQNVYFRTKAQGRFLTSDIQRLVVPERPAPVYTVNYQEKKTNEPVSVNDEYSTSPDMTGAYVGTGSTITITPGTDLYFRTKATTSSFRSAIQHLVVPTVPAPPAFTINYDLGTTNETAGTNIAISNYANFSGQIFGTGTFVTLVPGQDLYFKQVATGSSFGSDASHLVVPACNFLGYSGADTVTSSKFTVYAILTDQSHVLTLADIQVTNGTAQNLRTGNVFDIYPASKGWVTVVIPANSISENSFASNEVRAYYNVVTGVDEITDIDFEVFPNPSFDGLVQIRNNRRKDYQVCVYNVNGNMTKTFEVNGGGDQLIDMRAYPKGMYFLQISSDNYTRLHKIILQ
jgi:hypothetical protein